MGAGADTDFYGVSWKTQVCEYLGEGYSCISLIFPGL